MRCLARTGAHGSQAMLLVLQLMGTVHIFNWHSRLSGSKTFVNPLVPVTPGKLQMCHWSSSLVIWWVHECDTTSCTSCLVMLAGQFTSVVRQQAAGQNATSVCVCVSVYDCDSQRHFKFQSIDQAKSSSLVNLVFWSLLVALGSAFQMCSFSCASLMVLRFINLWTVCGSGGLWTEQVWGFVSLVALKSPLAGHVSKRLWVPNSRGSQNGECLSQQLSLGME